MKVLYGSLVAGHERVLHRFMHVVMLVKVLYGSLVAGHEQVLHSLNSFEENGNSLSVLPLA